MFKQRLFAVIATQVTSILISALIILADLDMNNSAEDVEAYGGTLTVMLIMVGLTAHFRSNKGPVPLGLIALIGVFAPAFAYASGPLINIAGYHILALGFHGIILRVQYRLEQKQAAGEVQKTDDDPGRAP